MRKRTPKISGPPPASNLLHTMSDQPSKCQSCGVLFGEHLGLIGTCEKLETLRRRINEFRRTFDLTPLQRERINVMLKELK